MITLEAAGLSDVGRYRERNEDRILVDIDHRVFVLADGMGGEQCGALAAELAVQSIGDYLSRTTADATLPDRMQQAVEFANHTVWSESQTRTECGGMGSTLSALLINGSEAAVANIGDSRVYLYRNGHLRCLTRDDAVVTNLIESGQITPAMARKHPLRNVLTAALGRTKDIIVQISQFSISPGDWLLLSSDGFHGVVDDDQIAQNFLNPQAPSVMVESMIRRALEQSSTDNISCISVACKTPLA